MTRQARSSKVELSVKADKALIKNDAPTERFLEISITPPELRSESERSALNLSLVLDRSGSMSGEKLHYVRKAAAHVIDLMEPKDQVSVVVYDDRVETLVPLANVTDEFKHQAKQRLQGVRSGNSTFLSGGWLRGCELAAEGAKPHSVNRTLLLTDGLANVGIRDAGELAFHAREIYQRGISTSCFGVGEGYDEHLLEGMSNNGGGNFHYLETLNAIPLIFEREFDELLRVSLRDVELNLQLTKGIVAQVLAGWTHEAVHDRLQISLGNLFSGKCQRVFIKLQFDENTACTQVKIPITVRGKGEGDYLCDATQTIIFTPASGGEVDAAPADQSLMERFTEVDMADRANEALKMEKVGNRRGASQLMRQSIQEHNLNMSPAMRSKFEFLTNEMSVGMSEEARKRHHQEEYDNKRGREVVRDYTLNLVNGHLMTTIEGQQILIDTGVPVSAGSPAEWYFLNEVHPLPQECMGVNRETLSHLVGSQVDILLGADILRKHHMTLDLANHRLHFSDRTLERFTEHLPMEPVIGLPTVTVAGPDKPCQMIIDTSEKLSYIDQNTASQFTQLDKVKDFYPGVGEFETAVFEVPFQLGHLKITLHCGVLPPHLEAKLIENGIHGILGTELYQKFLVDLAFPEHRLYLSEQN